MYPSDKFNILKIIKPNLYKNVRKKFNKKYIDSPFNMIHFFPIQTPEKSKAFDFLQSLFESS